MTCFRLVRRKCKQNTTNIDFAVFSFFCYLFRLATWKTVKFVSSCGGTKMWKVENTKTLQSQRFSCFAFSPLQAKTKKWQFFMWQSKKAKGQSCLRASSDSPPGENATWHNSATIMLQLFSQQLYAIVTSLLSYPTVAIPPDIMDK